MKSLYVKERERSLKFLSLTRVISTLSSNYNLSFNFNHFGIFDGRHLLKESKRLCPIHRPRASISRIVSLSQKCESKREKRNNHVSCVIHLDRKYLPVRTSSIVRHFSRFIESNDHRFQIKSQELRYKQRWELDFTFRQVFDNFDDFLTVRVSCFLDSWIVPSGKKLFFPADQLPLFLGSRSFRGRYERSIALVVTTNRALGRNVRTAFPESEITGIRRLAGCCRWRFAADCLASYSVNDEYTRREETAIFCGQKSNCILLLKCNFSGEIKHTCKFQTF